MWIIRVIKLTPWWCIRLWELKCFCFSENGTKSKKKYRFWRVFALWTRNDKAHVEDKHDWNALAFRAFIFIYYALPAWYSPDVVNLITISTQYTIQIDRKNGFSIITILNAIWAKNAFGSRKPKKKTTLNKRGEISSVLVFI